MKKNFKKIVVVAIAFIGVLALAMVITWGSILDVWLDAPTLVNPNR